MRPSVHFELNMADPVDHQTAVVLVRKALSVRYHVSRRRVSSTVG
jgi:hypothetical protein